MLAAIGLTALGILAVPAFWFLLRRDVPAAAPQPQPQPQPDPPRERPFSPRLRWATVALFALALAAAGATLPSGAAGVAVMLPLFAAAVAAGADRPALARRIGWAAAVLVLAWALVNLAETFVFWRGPRRGLRFAGPLAASFLPALLAATATALLLDVRAALTVRRP